MGRRDTSIQHQKILSHEQLETVAVLSEHTGMMWCGFWCYLFKRWILVLLHFSVQLPNTHSLFSLTVIPHISSEEAAPPLHVALKTPERNTCQGSSAGRWLARCWPHVLCRPSQGQHDSILRFFLGHRLDWTLPFSGMDAEMTLHREEKAPNSEAAKSENES